MANNTPHHQATRQRFLGNWREKLFELAIYGLPTSIFGLIYDRVARHVLAAPWQVLLVLLPFVCLTWVAWRLVRRQGLRRLDWRMLLFCSAYSVIFAFASTAQLTAWKRQPVSGQEATHDDWVSLFPIRWGDWRYSLVRDPPVRNAIPIALLLLEQSPDATKEDLRYRDLKIIDLAKRGNVAGLALDSIYSGTSNIDDLFCKEIRSFVEKNKEEPPRALATAYEMRPVPELERYERYPDTAEQPACLVQSQQGHAMGLADVDGLVRGIPLYWESPQRKHPALSLQLMDQLKKPERKKAREPDFFLRILPAPDGAIAIYGSQQKREALYRHPDALSGVILVVGDQSQRDNFHTPFGDFPGAQLHAFAIYDMLNGYSLTRPPQTLYALLISAACIFLALLANGTAPLRRLLLGATAMTAFILVLAFNAMRFLSVWVDAIYPIVGIWLLIPLLLIHRRRSTP